MTEIEQSACELQLFKDLNWGGGGLIPTFTLYFVVGGVHFLRILRGHITHAHYSPEPPPYAEAASR